MTRGASHDKQNPCQSPHDTWQVGLIFSYLSGLARTAASIYDCRHLFWKATRLMFVVNAANIAFQNVFMWAAGAPVRISPFWETPEGGLTWVLCQLLCAIILRPSVRHAMHRARFGPSCDTRHFLPSPLPPR